MTTCALGHQTRLNYYYYYYVNCTMYLYLPLLSHAVSLLWSCFNVVSLIITSILDYSKAEGLHPIAAFSADVGSSLVGSSEVESIGVEVGWWIGW